MQNYYKSYYHKPKRKKLNIFPFVLIILIVVSLFYFLKQGSKQSPQTSNKTNSTPTTISQFFVISIKSNLKTRFTPYINEFKADNPAITISYSDKTPDLVISDKKPTILYTTTKTVLSQSITISPQAFSKIIPSKPYEIYASYNDNSTSKNLSDFLISKLSNPSTKQTSLFAVGDIMLSRHVYTITKGSGNYNYPFLKTYDKIKSADISFANFEAPIYNQGIPVTAGMSFKVEPKMTSGIKLSGFDILSLANNHFGNQGQAGMLYTTKYLKKNDINYCGGGKDDEEAYAPTYITKNNLKFAFLCYTDQRIDPRIAGPDKPGNAMMYESKLKEGIVTARKNADIVIVSMHSGIEYTPDPNFNQKKFARSAIKYGADMVIGHHPHVVQAMEIYQGKPILYSLGNFIFDQMWSPETTQGITADIVFEGKIIKSIDIKPIKILNYAQPYFLPHNSEYNSIINRIITASNKLQE